ncbi:hypothetical protein EDB86DRAFT_2834444 [Lactarius hatsudake]|nr:hypothetical protein EDB86DRAFT_2834444 [Lactarius hatsudake]
MECVSCDDVKNLCTPAIDVPANLSVDRCKVGDLCEKYATVFWAKTAPKLEVRCLFLPLHLQSAVAERGTSLRGKKASVSPHHAPEAGPLAASELQKRMLSTDLHRYAVTLEEMAAASLDVNFKEELSAIEQYTPEIAAPFMSLLE